MSANKSLRLIRLFPEPVASFTVIPPVQMGRHPDAEICFTEEDASRLHAVIEPTPGSGFLLRDGGSRNGTYLNGQRVGVHKLKEMDVLRIGRSVLWLAPKRSFQQQLQSFLTTHRGARIVRFYGEIGSGRAHTARVMHETLRPEGPFMLLDGTPPLNLLKILKGGTLVVRNLERRRTSALRDEAPKHDVRIVLIDDEAHKDSIPELEIQPLRHRLDELPAALDGILGPKAVDADFFEALACHSFTSNFIELQVLARVLARSKKPFGISLLPDPLRARLVDARNTVSTEVTRGNIEDALARHRGNVLRAGQEMGIPRGHLYRLLASYGINPDKFRGLVSPVLPEIDRGDEYRTHA